MAVYRGKYILEGLGTISPEMEHNLDIAYGICMSYRDGFPCEMCGRCCHQPHIVVRPEEIDRISSAADIPLYDFMRNYLVQTSDGRFLFKKTNPCAFLGPDNRCRIWSNRPQICDDFPYAVSMFMSRVYLALTNQPGRGHHGPDLVHGRRLALHPRHQGGHPREDRGRPR